MYLKIIYLEHKIVYVFTELTALNNNRFVSRKTWEPNSVTLQSQIGQEMCKTGSLFPRPRIQ